MNLADTTLEQCSVALGIAAGAIQLLGYIAYMKFTKNTGASSWLIWTMGAVVDGVSYATVTHYDWVKVILPAVCALACVCTFAYLLYKGRLGKLQTPDYVIIAIDASITALWLRVGSAILANLLYQVSTAISFYPLVKDQLQDKYQEHPVPWLLWTAAYGLMFGSVLLRLDSLVELAYPAVNFIAHLVVLVIAVAKLRPSR